MKRLIYSMTAVAALLISGCSTTSTENNENADDIRAVVAANYEDAVIEVKAIGPEMINAFIDKDFELFTSRLTPAQKVKLNKEAMDKVSDSFSTRLGEIESIEYLTELRVGLITTFLWKVCFVKDSETKPGEKIRNDLLYKVAIGMDDESYVIASFGW